MACRAQPDPAATAGGGTSPLRWQALGAWSGSGDRQTESFDITTGSLRVVWESEGRFRLTLHSAISGRPLETVAEASGAGSDTVRLAAEPRVAYLLIEADPSAWSIKLEEGIPVPQE